MLLYSLHYLIHLLDWLILLAKALAGLQTVTADNTVNKGDTTVSVKTGDESLAGMFAGLALLSIAGYTVLRKKKINN